MIFRKLTCFSQFFIIIIFLNMKTIKVGTYIILQIRMNTEAMDEGQSHEFVAL